MSLKEFDPEYANTLDLSVEEAEKRENLISFKMENFLAYTPSHQ